MKSTNYIDSKELSEIIFQSKPSVPINFFRPPFTVNEDVIVYEPLSNFEDPKFIEFYLDNVQHVYIELNGEKSAYLYYGDNFMRNNIELFLIFKDHTWNVSTYREKLKGYMNSSFSERQFDKFYDNEYEN